MKYVGFVNFYDNSLFCVLLNYDIFNKILEYFERMHFFMKICARYFKIDVMSIISYGDRYIYTSCYKKKCLL